jgi:beta-fructofuranosidase
MLGQYEELDKKIEKYYAAQHEHPWRNQFHIEMPFGLVNDPNGLSYYNQKFHIFYQWNPFGCEHKNKHWALVTTTDFIHYSKPKIVLKPKDWFDKDGCYSGSGFVKDDAIKLVYTGNVKDKNNNRESYQCIATYHQDGSVTKDAILIKNQPEGYTAHFRDPFVFQINEMFYMILGVQTNNLQGRALLYQSKEFKDWTLVGELKTSMPDFGYMWECPNLVKVSEGKYAFIFSPQGLEAEEVKYQNIYQSGYVIGQLDVTVPALNHNEFKELDMGFDFYAPQVFTHDGRTLLIGWVGMPDKDHEYPTAKDGWLYALTMPRVLEYRDGVLYQRPVRELLGLRGEPALQVKPIVCDHYAVEVPNRSAEILLDLDLRQNDEVLITLACEQEYMTLHYDKVRQIVTIDRNHMKLGGKGVRKFTLDVQNELKLQLFIDRSVIEIYYQDGLEVTTLMYFPKTEVMNFAINSASAVRINELKLWQLSAIQYE